MTADSIEAIKYGMLFLKIIAPFYIMISAKIVVDGLMRGAGAMLAFTTSTFLDLILRVILAFIFSDIMDSATGIWLSWPFGWTIATILSFIFYFKGNWRKGISMK